MATSDGAVSLTAEYEFKNKDDPLKDDQIVRIGSRMSMIKRQITQNINKAKSTAKELTKLKNQAATTENNRVVTGMIISGGRSH